MNDHDATRRALLKAGGGAAGLTAAHPGLLQAQPLVSPQGSPPDGQVAVRLEVNGHARTVTVDPRRTLLDLLRDDLDLTGTKVGCNQGTCGACTVHLDGRRVLSCLTLAVSVQGRSVTTIEGLRAPDGGLHPMQRAFVEQDALQCGYCTPGQVMSAVACVHEGNAGSDAEIRETLSGNLCRCAAYPRIVAAVRQGRKEMLG